MARRPADEAVLTTVVARLTSQTTSATYTEVPQGTEPPYVQVSAVTATRQDTYGRWGEDTMVDVHAISAGPSQQAGSRMRKAAIQALDMQPSVLNTSGHTVLGVRWSENEYYPEMVNGVKYHHHVATFRIWTEQSTT